MDNGVLPTNGGLFTRLSSKPEGEGAARYPEGNPRKRTTIPQSATIGKRTTIPQSATIGLAPQYHQPLLLSDLSDVKNQFAHTSKRAEEGYVTHLCHHYDTVVHELKLKQSLLLDTMATVTTQEEKVVHMDMLKKTDSNVKKLTYCKSALT